MRFVIISTLALCLACSGSAFGDKKPKPNLSWEFPANDLPSCVKAYKGPYRLRIINCGEIVLITNRQKVECYRVRMAFRIVGDVVYEVDYNRGANGCALIAFDLKNGKRIWRTPLKGLGPIPHFGYTNNVAIKTSGNHIVVYGHEAAGKYVEHVSMKTGKTVAHKKH